MKRVAVGLLAGVAATANAAAPIVESTRIALNVGWRYTPNATFAQQASTNGYPLAGTPVGGPAALLTFAYEFTERFEVAIELGYNAERFTLVGAPPLTLSSVPILVDFRWWFASWQRVAFYAGAGAGYLMNFWTGGPTAYFEAPTATPVLMLGMAIALNETLAVVIEDRETLARVLAENVGMAQVGGNTLTVGLHYSLGVSTRTGPLF